MRILLYSWPFYPSVGGLERLTELTASYLAGAGHRVTVVSATSDPLGAGPRFPFAVERRPGWRRLYRLVRGADLVHLNTFSARILGLAKALRKPVIWQHIDFDTVSPRGICHALGRPCPGSLRLCYRCLRGDHSRARAIRAIGSLLLKRAAVRAVAANAISTRYAEERMRLPRAVHLPFGMDLSRFAPSQRTPPPPLRILFYGRHVPAKGCDVLVRAAHACRGRGLPLSVRVAGDGPHRSSSEALAKSLGLGETVLFLGQLADERLIAELQGAHVVVVPTTQDEIGQFVAWEGMSSGCVVVASRIGAFPEHLGEAGLLFPPGDVLVLADALERLSSDSDLLVSLATRGRERVLAHFDWRLMGRRYVELYGRLCNGIGQ